MSVLRFLRFHDWGIQLPIMWTAAGAMYWSLPVRPADYWTTVGWLTLAQSLLLAGAYTINDYFDWDADGAHAAPRPLPLARSSRLFAALLLYTMSLLLAHRTLAHTGALRVLWLQVLFGTGYSAPPLRLKERALWGVFAAATLQRIPPFLMLVLWVSAPFAIAAPLVLWLLAIGLLFIIEHQVQDAARDRSAGVRTFVLRLSAFEQARLRRSLYLLFTFAATGAALVILATRRNLAALAAAAILLAATSTLRRILKSHYAGNERMALGRAVTAPVSRP